MQIHYLFEKKLSTQLTVLSIFCFSGPIFYYYFGVLVDKGRVSQERPTRKSTSCCWPNKKGEMWRRRWWWWWEKFFLLSRSIILLRLDTKVVNGRFSADIRIHVSIENTNYHEIIITHFTCTVHCCISLAQTKPASFSSRAREQGGLIYIIDPLILCTSFIIPLSLRIIYTSFPFHVQNFYTPNHQPCSEKNDCDVGGTNKAQFW